MNEEFTIIGFGKVGRTLSLLMEREGAPCRLRTIAYQRNHPSVVSGKSFSSHSTNEVMGDKSTLALNINEVRHIQGITAITVPDDAIGQLSEKLSTQCEIAPGTIVFHCSGVHTSEVLAALRAKGAFTASIHPAFSFGDPSISANSFTGTICTYEGDEEAINILVPIFRSFGGTLIPIDPQLKATYHAGCCVASNYLVGLYALSENILVSAGVPQNAIPSILIPLMKSTLNNLSQNPPVKALSGPIARNDALTVALHTQILSEEHACHYKYLGKLLIDQTGLLHREQIEKILIPYNTPA